MTAPPMSDLPTGPEYIKFARTRNNMSQRDLAAEVGVGYPHISKIETGKERPSRDLCHKIAACLDVSGDRLAAMFGYLPDWADELLRTHPSGTLVTLARLANSIIDGDGERSIRSKTGQEHVAALAAAGYRIVPIVDDATRQERPGLTPEWLTRMAIACRNVQEQAQPKNVEWFDWVPERLDRAAAYLGRTD